jgi:hypothetical protein
MPISTPDTRDSSFEWRESTAFTAVSSCAGDKSCDADILDSTDDPVEIKLEEEELPQRVEDLSMEDDNPFLEINNTLIFETILQAVKKDITRALNTPGIRSNFNEGVETTYSEWCTFVFEPLSFEMDGPTNGLRRLVLYDLL